MFSPCGAAELAMCTSGEHAPRRLREQARPHLQVCGSGQPLQGGRIHILLHQLDLTDMAFRYVESKLADSDSEPEVSIACADHGSTKFKAGTGMESCFYGCY